MSGNDEIAILEQNVINSINDILTKQKLHYIEHTFEFIKGLMVGLEVAKLYGESIQKLNTSQSTDIQ